jgi:hypothetical protein
MKVHISDSISIQRQKIANGNQVIHLIKPCSLNDGIIQLPEILPETQLNASVTWFIPSSGSGSRMFQFLHDFLKNQLVSTELQVFIQNLNRFPFFDMLEDKHKNVSIQNIPELVDLVEFILFRKGLNFSDLPKGLIPFHSAETGLNTAFQDQYIQGKRIQAKQLDFHFTIQKDYQLEIEESILRVRNENDFPISFSVQNSETDSFVFDNKLELIVTNDALPLRKPAGHGSLLENLNQIQADFVLLKNIDNVQHSAKCELSITSWNYLFKYTQIIKNQLIDLFENPSFVGLNELNKIYQFSSEESIDSIENIDDIRALINRPLRVCGMVKNSGQPGGGPFWIEKNGVVSKQIVEQAQISTIDSQQQIMKQSTHFNPVMIIASVKDAKGEKYNLAEYRDNESYFIVHKKHEGNDIQFIENPGLWNGSMANWLTVFVELPAETFSPVKTVLDLLNEMHQL